MSRCGHALHRGFVYVMPAEASLTFIRMIDVNTYIHKLLANDALRDRILRYMTRTYSSCHILSTKLLLKLNFTRTTSKFVEGSSFESHPGPLRIAPQICLMEGSHRASTFLKTVQRYRDRCTSKVE